MISNNHKSIPQFRRHSDVDRKAAPSRDRYRTVFTRLDPKRAVTSSAFRDAEYYGVKLDKSALANAAAILSWCYDAYNGGYAWIEDYMWFLTEEDAMLFRFTWGKY